MPYHANLHCAFLNAHHAVNWLAGAWLINPPDRDIRNARIRLVDALAAIDAHLAETAAKDDAK